MTDDDVWAQDGCDPGWFTRDGIGAIRSQKSYRPGGWWFLPSWLPDNQKYDIGPFRTKNEAISAAIELAKDDANG